MVRMCLFFLSLIRIRSFTAGDGNGSGVGFVCMVCCLKFDASTIPMLGLPGLFFSQRLLIF